MAGEADRARGRLHGAGDDVEQRRLAGAVGADDGADLAVLDPHRHLVERHQGAVAARHAVELEQRHDQRFSAAVRKRPVARPVASPQMPSGANSTKAMKIRPKYSAQASVQALSWCSISMKKAAPRIGPTRVPAPPTITMISTWPDSSQNRSSVLAKPA